MQKLYKPTLRIIAKEESLLNTRKNTQSMQFETKNFLNDNRLQNKDVDGENLIKINTKYVCMCVLTIFVLTQLFFFFFLYNIDTT